MSDPRAQEGFSIIELAVAVAVFGIVIVGLSVSFQSAFRSTAQARHNQVAKQLAQERLEEIRSLPFYIAYRENNADVDILDRYFPRLNTSNQATPTGATGRYDPTTGVWTYTSERSLTRPGVPTLTEVVTVQFVVVDGSGNASPRAPIASYNSDNADFDRPATDTLRVTVGMNWTFQGRPESVDLETLVSRVTLGSPKVDASGSIIGASISGVLFEDGDVGTVAADVSSDFVTASVEFREVAEGSAQASAQPLEVREEEPEMNSPLQDPKPIGGSAFASVPNSTTGTTQLTNVPLASGSMSSINTPPQTIASWCTGSATCSANAEGRVSTTHVHNPESKAVVSAHDFLLNSRRRLDVAPRRVFQTASANGTVEQTSTTNRSKVVSTVTMSGVKIWASQAFLSNPRYEGTVIIDSLTVLVEAEAGETVAENVVQWSATNVRVWNPNRVNADASIGGYAAGASFGYDSACGQWVGSPASCAPPHANPNPVTIPSAYQGVDVDGNSATSLSIVAGATVTENVADAGQGLANVSTSQKNILTIITRNDIVGAAQLEPSITNIGSATATVTYVKHEH